MLLKEFSEEFIFNCECRKLSPKTIRNYEKQISCLLAFLEQEHEITELGKVTTRYIKEFLVCILRALQNYIKYMYRKKR